MSKAIYKYRLPFMEKAQVVMKEDADIIRVDGLDGALWLWAIVDTEAEEEIRHFELFKTGGEMPDNIEEYIYHGCGAIFIQMELMMYVFEKPGTAEYVGERPAPFDWKAVQEDNQ